jgi:ATP-dependent RNA circularization protein (DNA/RNA ligase family)
MESEQSQADEYVKYPRILSVVDLSQIGRRAEDSDLFVFEKIDGGNCQVRNIGGWNLVAGSRGNVLSGGILNRFEWFKKFKTWVHSNDSLYELPVGMVMFGEWSGNHNIEYGPLNNDKFFFIDLFDMNDRRFVQYDEAFEFLQGLGIKGIREVPVLLRGREVTPENLERKMIDEGSMLYPGPKEGLVIKDYRTQSSWKVYHPRFTELSPRSEGVYDPLTPSRYSKALYAAVEAGKGELLDRSGLVDAVLNNVKDELGIEVSRQDVSKRLNDYLGEDLLGEARKYLRD